MGYRLSPWLAEETAFPAFWMVGERIVSRGGNACIGGIVEWMFTGTDRIRDAVGCYGC